MENNVNSSNVEVVTKANINAANTLDLITWKINHALDNLQLGMYEIAGLLHEASKYISDSEYKSLGEYAEKNFGFKKARASQLKTVAERFLVKKVDELGTPYYECKLPSGERPWTVDALYVLNTKFNNNKAIEELIENGTISSDMSNKAIANAIEPKKEAPKLETTASEAPASEAPASEAPASEAPASEAPASEAPASEAPATEAQATEAQATDVLHQIHELVSLALAVCENHKNSAVTKALIEPLTGIEKLTR